MTAKTSPDLPASSSRWRWPLAYVSTVLVIIFLVLLTGINPQRIYAYDSFILFDGSWRIEQGYVPYKDFYMLIGPLSLLIMAGTMALTHDSPMAEPLSVVLSLIPLSIVTWSIVRKSYTPPIAFLIFLYLCLLWCSSFPIHFLFYNTSYAMFENRQGYVLISLLLLLLLPGNSLDQARRSFLTSFCIGLLLACILFEKANYAVSALALIIGLLNTNILREIIGILCGFVTGFLPFYLFLGNEGLQQMLEALHSAAGLRSGFAYLEGAFLIIVEMPVLGFLLLFLLIPLKNHLDFGTHVRFFKKHSLVIRIWTLFRSPFYILAVIVLVSISLEMGGYPIFKLIDVPLLFVYAMTILDTYLCNGLLKSSVPLRDLHFVTFGLLILVPLLNLSLGLLFPLYSLTFDSGKHHVTLESPWCPLTVFDEQQGLENLPEHNEGVLINDGLRLIRKHPELDNQRIATFYFADAFSYCLHRKSPPHMPAFLHIGTNITAEHCPPAEYILTDCGAVMVCLTPQTFEFNIVQGIPSYTQYLNEHFVLKDQSQSWALWVRK